MFLFSKPDSSKAKIFRKLVAFALPSSTILFPSMVIMLDAKMHCSKDNVYPIMGGDEACHINISTFIYT